MLSSLSNKSIITLLSLIIILLLINLKQNSIITSNISILNNNISSNNFKENSSLVNLNQNNISTKTNNDYAYSKAIECISQNNYIMADIFINHYLSNNVNEWDKIKSYSNSIFNNIIEKDSSISSSEVIIIYSRLENVLKNCYVKIEPTMIDDWSNTVSELNNKIFTLTNTESNNTDNINHKSIIFDIINNNSDEVSFSLLNKVIELKSSFNDFETSETLVIQSWIDHNVLRIQIKDAKNEFEKIYEYAINSYFDNYFIALAENQLNNIKLLKAKGLEKNVSINELNEVEDIYKKLLFEHDAIVCAATSQDINTLINKLEIINSSNELSLSCEIPDINHILENTGNLGNNMFSIVQKKEFFRSVDKMKKLYDLALVKKLESSFNNIISSSINNKEKISELQILLSNPPKELSNISDDKANNNFTSLINKIKLHIYNIQKEQMKSYQRWALRQIDSAHEKFKSIPNVKLPFGKSKIDMAIEAINDLVTLDTTLLEIDVRRSYDEVYNEIYTYISDKDSMILINRKFYETEKKGFE